MVKITDADALAKMAKIEGEEWKSLQMATEENRYSFLGVLTYFKTRKKWGKDFPVGTIYGNGGWNRWHVYGDGEIRFSEHHSRQTAMAYEYNDTNEAKELGFKTV